MGVPSVRRALGAALLVALVTVAAPPHVAADDVGSIVLADDSLGTMVADLDGDGEREVIAIRRHPDDAARIVVEAWGMVGGEWRSLGSTPLERWDEESPVRRPAEFGRDGFGLLSLRDSPRARVIVATSSARDGSAGEYGVPCCLSLSELRHGDTGLSLDLLEGTYGSAENLQVADLDGDGSDELLVGSSVTGTGDVGVPMMEYVLLRQDGDVFVAEELTLGDQQTNYLAMAGDTDGVVGDDLLFTTDSGSHLTRVVEQDGTLRVEVALTESFSTRLRQGWPAGAADGLIAWVEEQGVSLVRWPRDGSPEITVEHETGEFPSLFLLAAERGFRFVEFGSFWTGEIPDDPTIRIYDEELRLEQVVAVPDLTLTLWELNSRGPFSASVPDRYLWEQIGPVPFGLGPDHPAVLGYGSMIELGPDGTPTVSPAAHVLGVGVTGAAGEGNEWLAVAGEWWGSGTSAYLGNLGYEPSFGMVGVIERSWLLDAGRERRPAVQFGGAAVVDVDGEERVYTSGEPFTLTVAGQPGDVIVAYDGRRTVTEEIVADSATLTIEPPGRSERNVDFELVVLVIGRTGVTTGATWPGAALRAGPELTAGAEMEALSLQATVAGTVSPDVTLTVDGRSVVPSPTGNFRVEVDAPIWPRDVVVVARDRAGNEAVQRLEVIGFADYRGFPWIPIVGTLTVVAGLVLFVRTPRLRPEERLRPDGDARLEEIDGDLI